MYAHIRGEITEVYKDRAVLEAAGVGYELFCSGHTLGGLEKGRQAKLYAHLHLNEDVMALYGFQDESEREMFRRLISVTRVGPKLALGVLSVLRPADVAAAIYTNNEDALASVPGLGKKTAQRLLLELKEKIGVQDVAASAGAKPDAGEANIRAEAVAALVGLGYDGASAQKAVLSVAQAENIEQLITQSLRALARQ